MEKEPSITKYYILADDNSLVECDSPITAMVWLAQNEDRLSVGSETVGGTWISTVFLGFTHMGGVFETAIFDKLKRVSVRERYYTWKEAKAGHDGWVTEVTREMNG